MKYLPLNLAFFAILSSLQATEVKADSKQKTVDQILSVTYHIEKKNPPNLIVIATGQVPTSGYKNAILTKVEYVMPPADGIQDYYLTATPPSGISNPVLSKVKAQNKWDGYTDDAPWLKGIRVHGTGNGIVERHFNESRKFIGVSNKGSLQDALNNAIAKLGKALGEGGVSDAMADWKIIKTEGTTGGIAGQNKVIITISAKRSPPWKTLKKHGK
ncbi:MAG: hypothetical protein COA78_15690 [Blastopirellula sp.]|nr:MAG: hypothetical protein COA78_15690 [Blastopirellula sp.]